MSKGYEVGRISACIAGDHRYTTVIRVTYFPKTKSVEVTREENGATGGMDGRGGSEPFCVLQRVSIARPDGKSIVKAVKMVMDDTIRTYGKPTKNFCFNTGATFMPKVGLSAQKAQRALEITVANAFFQEQ
jgi:hypothetical protein